MTRAQINQIIAQYSGGVPVQTTEQVLMGLERFILQESAKGGNKFAKIMGLYQNWKKG